MIIVITHHRRFRELRLTIELCRRWAPESPRFVIADNSPSIPADMMNWVKAQGDISFHHWDENPGLVQGEAFLIREGLRIARGLESRFILKLGAAYAPMRADAIHEAIQELEVSNADILLSPAPLSHPAPFGLCSSHLLLRGDRSAAFLPFYHGLWFTPEPALEIRLLHLVRELAVHWHPWHPRDDLHRMDGSSDFFNHISYPGKFRFLEMTGVLCPDELADLYIRFAPEYGNLDIGTGRYEPDVFSPPIDTGPHKTEWTNNREGERSREWFPGQ